MVDPTWISRGGAAGAVARLGRVEELSGLDDEQLLELAADADRLAAWAAEKQARVILELDARRQQTEHAIDELAVALRITRRAAQLRVELAFALAAQPRLAAAMDAGRIDARKAREIADAVIDLRVPGAAEGGPDPQLVAAIVDDAVTYAEVHTPTELAAWLRRRVITTDRQAAEDRRARKLANRELSLEPLADGMAYLTAYGSAHLLSAVFNTAHACALALPASDERTLAQASFDAFVELVRRGAAAGQIPGALGRRARIVLSGGADDNVVELAGVGAVPGSMLGDVARDAAVSYERVQTPVSEHCDEHCTPDRGYAPSPATRRAVQAHRPRCVFPGCRVPATSCDLDHTVPWPAGRTCVHNLAPVCRRHHELKTKGVWDLSGDRDDVLVWTSPAGLTYPVDDERAGPPPKRRHLQLLELMPLEEPPEPPEPPEFQWYDWDPEFDDPPLDDWAVGA
jgi:hypothetical protein